jgi:hypothetical protein
MNSMNSILFNSPLSDQERRQKLYEGQLFVYSASPSAKALCDHAREMIEEAFGELDPTTAQYELPVEEFAGVLTDLKPKFIHHPKSKEHLRGLLRELGCDLEKTYFDVPRMRTSTSDDYLTTGISYAFHPHRDTWYSAAACQLNWWLPIYEVVPENVMAFHSRYWAEPVKNGSSEFNYYEWNTARKDAGKHIKKDPRKQPKPEEPIDLDPQVRVVAPPGGVMIFSAAHLHSTVPNTSGRTRFSIDFRTVNLDDLEARNGAPNVDSECTGTSLRDFLRGTDLVQIPDDLVAAYDDESHERGDLVYQPEGVTPA